VGGGADNQLKQLGAMGEETVSTGGESWGLWTEWLMVLLKNKS